MCGERRWMIWERRSWKVHHLNMMQYDHLNIMQCSPLDASAMQCTVISLWCNAMHFALVYVQNPMSASLYQNKVQRVSHNPWHYCLITIKITIFPSYIWRLSVGVITNEYKLGLFYDQLSPVSFISHWERLVTGMQGMQSQCQSHSNHYHLDCTLQIDTHIARCSFKPVPYIWSFERVGCLGGCQGFNVNVNVNWNHAHNIA